MLNQCTLYLPIDTIESNVNLHGCQSDESANGSQLCSASSLWYTVVQVGSLQQELNATKAELRRVTEEFEQVGDPEPES